ncbi:MAG: DUF952 domain-containing protein [Bacteroidota bacterium]
MIYHITTQHDWNAKKDQSHFLPTDFDREGFIHCSTTTQVAGVLERYFKGQTGLVLLHLDETKLTSELKYEVSTGNEKFPHLYGPINREAIMKVEML